MIDKRRTERLRQQSAATAETRTGQLAIGAHRQAHRLLKGERQRCGRMLLDEAAVVGVGLEALLEGRRRGCCCCRRRCCSTRRKRWRLFAATDAGPSSTTAGHRSWRTVEYVATEEAVVGILLHVGEQHGRIARTAHAHLLLLLLLLLLLEQELLLPLLLVLLLDEVLVLLEEQLLLLAQRDVLARGGRRRYGRRDLANRFGQLRVDQVDLGWRR